MLRKQLKYFKSEYVIPTEVINKSYSILEDEELGEYGYIAIIMYPLLNDMQEIEDIINYYPHHYSFDGDIISISVEKKKNRLSRKKEWYLDILNDVKECNKIYVFYCMKVKDVYKKKYI